MKFSYAFTLLAGGFLTSGYHSMQNPQIAVVFFYSRYWQHRTWRMGIGRRIMTQNLIDRLSKLTGPRYTMDVAIALATDFWPKDRIQNIVYNDDGDPWVYFTDGPDLPLPPSYTASVDAAIALSERVLPGWKRSFFENFNGKWIARVCSPRRDLYSTDYLRDTELGGSPNGGIALCIAILHAKEASNGN